MTRRNQNLFFAGSTCFLAVILIFYFGFSNNNEDDLSDVKHEPFEWSQQDIAFLNTFWIKNLPPVKADLSNAVADSKEAAKLGEKIFFDPRFSVNGEVSCATCHEPQKYFTDGVALAKGIKQTTRNTPTIIGTAYSSWYFWDGRKDSQWAQALGPLEDLSEHGATRTFYIKKIAQHYRDEYQALFGELPDISNADRFPDLAGPLADEKGRELWDNMEKNDQRQITRAFTNIGKAIAAYERLLVPNESKFDRYVEAVVNGDIEKQQEIFSHDEIAGLRLFLGKANCSQCHTGPLFTNQAFHNIGLPPLDLEAVELGRIETVSQVARDEFNCVSEYSDTKECLELKFVKRNGFELIGAFKTPSLRNISETAPYMHRGNFKTLKEVLAHYNTAPIPFYDPEQHTERPHSDLMELKLSEAELSQLETFLLTLTGEVPTPAL